MEDSLRNVGQRLHGLEYEMLQLKLATAEMLRSLGIDPEELVPYEHCRN